MRRVEQMIQQSVRPESGGSGRRSRKLVPARGGGLLSEARWQCNREIPEISGIFRIQNDHPSIT
jgi:hypothetical protein